jgi:dihydrofolate synthase/folylpolyglutamate synthase
MVAVVLAPTPHRHACLADWLAWQERLHGREIELGLERCRTVASRLGLGPPAYTVVSVAGTNGKGSSVAMLSAILRASGYRIGTYTSPHLLRYNERIRIGDAPVCDEAICDAFQRIDDARGDVTLTFFEFGTLAALDLFSRAQIEIAVLEVGLGGRLDAVNLVDADVALVTAIDLDHLEWLGHDRESIAREKAGIFRAGRPAVCSDPRPPRAIAEAAAEVGAELYQLGRDFDYRAGQADWIWESRRSAPVRLPRPRLAGDFQFENAAGVMMVLEALACRHPTAVAARDAGLREVRLSGRFEVLPGEPEVVLDVAHNPHAASSLARTLASSEPRDHTHVIVGMLKDKDFRGVLSALSGVADSWHVVDLPSSRAASAAQLEGALRELGVPAPIRRYRTPASAHERVVRAVAGARDRILVYGSFLTVAGVLHGLRR